MCLLAVLGLQGIVVKCTAAIFFRTVVVSLTTLSKFYVRNSNYLQLYYNVS